MNLVRMHVIEVACYIQLVICRILVNTHVNHSIYFIVKWLHIITGVVSSVSQKKMRMVVLNRIDFNIQQLFSLFKKTIGNWRVVIYVQLEMYSTRSILRVYCTLYIMCTEYSSLYIVHCTVHIVHCTTNILQYTIYTVQYTLYIVHYTTCELHIVVKSRIV